MGRTFKTKLTTRDSTIFLNYLNQTNEVLKDSLLEHYELKNNIRSLFNNIEADHILISYITYYQLGAYGSRSINTWYIIRFYVIDRKKNNILFYRSAIDYGINSYRLWSPYYDVPTKKINYLIRPYKKFIKQNIKHLKS